MISPYGCISQNRGYDKDQAREERLGIYLLKLAKARRVHP